MKKLFAALLAALLLVPVLSLAQGSVLMVELPEDAQMVENVAFDDGDFIQTYQLGNGGQVQLLRYAAFDMTLGELFASEWVGATDVRELGVASVGGYPAQGLRFSYQEEGQAALDVVLVVVDAGETLVMSAVFPAGTADAQLETMLGSLNVMNEDAAPAGDTADVG